MLLFENGGNARYPVAGHNTTTPDHIPIQGPPRGQGHEELRRLRVEVVWRLCFAGAKGEAAQY